MINISPKEYKDLLEAWKQMRQNNKSSQSFFMIVQWVPVGTNGGRLVCRPVEGPIDTEAKTTN